MQARAAPYTARMTHLQRQQQSTISNGNAPRLPNTWNDRANAVRNRTNRQTYATGPLTESSWRCFGQCGTSRWRHDRQRTTANRCDIAATARGQTSQQRSGCTQRLPPTSLARSAFNINQSASQQAWDRGASRKGRTSVVERAQAIRHHRAERARSLGQALRVRQQRGRRRNV